MNRVLFQTSFKNEGNFFISLGWGGEIEDASSDESIQSQSQSQGASLRVHEIDSGQHSVEMKV